VRSYPNGSMLCHVLGFVNDEGRGVEGIEASMNQVLQGQDGIASSSATAPIANSCRTVAKRGCRATDAPSS
jgi:cell division protein FtsI/penicillin-binding protein 2